MSSRSSNEGGVQANWPPNALLVLETSSPYTDVPTSFDHVVFEANTMLFHG